MSEIQRPDLSQAEPEVRAYIEALEAEVARLQQDTQPEAGETAAPKPAEPPTTMNVITISRNGLAKRTPRHLYGRQRRGGMGVFDLETGEEDHANVLTVVDENNFLLLFTDFGRAFRLSVADLPEAEVRDRGRSLSQMLSFRPHERVVAALPAGGGEFVVLASQRGWVRRVRRSYLGGGLIPGMSFHNVKEGGYLVAACWTDGDGELLMLTRQGKGIRFLESQVPSRGCLGIRVHIEDAVTAVAAVTEESAVLLLGDDGRGTLRLMSGFNANKAPGSGGKTAMKTDHLVGAVPVSEPDDIFIASGLNKIIRFSAGEVPAKEGVVQGVNCMSLRSDTVTAVTACPIDA